MPRLKTMTCAKCKTPVRMLIFCGKCLTPWRPAAPTRPNGDPMSETVKTPAEREHDLLLGIASAAMRLDQKIRAEELRGSPLCPLGSAPEFKWTDDYPAELTSLRDAIEEFAAFEVGE